MADKPTIEDEMGNFEFFIDLSRKAMGVPGPVSEAIVSEFRKSIAGVFYALARDIRYSLQPGDDVAEGIAHTICLKADQINEE